MEMKKETIAIPIYTVPVLLDREKAILHTLIYPKKYLGLFVSVFEAVLSSSVDTPKCF